MFQDRSSRSHLSRDRDSREQAYPPRAPYSASSFSVMLMSSNIAMQTAVVARQVVERQMSDTPVENSTNPSIRTTRTRINFKQHLSIWQEPVRPIGGRQGARAQLATAGSSRRLQLATCRR